MRQRKKYSSVFSDYASSTAFYYYFRDYRQYERFDYYCRTRKFVNYVEKIIDEMASRSHHLDMFCLLTQS